MAKELAALTSLRAGEVSLVDRGANKKKRFPVFKARDPSSIQTLIFDKGKFSAAEAKAWARDHDFSAGKIDETEDSWRIRQNDPGAFEAGSFKTIELKPGIKAVIGRQPAKKAEQMPDDNEQEQQEILKAVLATPVDGEEKLAEMFKGLSGKGMAAVRSALRIMSSYKDEMPGHIGMMRRLAKLIGEDDGEDEADDEEEAKKDDAEDEEEGAYEARRKGKAMRKDLEGVPEEVRKQMEPIMKAHEEEVRKAQEAVSAVTKQLEETNKTLKIERDAQAEREWIAKSEKDLAYFPGSKAEDMGKTLKALADVNPELAKQQFERMKAASDAIKKGALLSESGTGAGMPRGGVNPDGAWARIQKMADGFVEKSAGELTKATAIARVMKAQPELYNEYLREHPAQVAATGYVPQGSVRDY